MYIKEGGLMYDCYDLYLVGSVLVLIFSCTKSSLEFLFVRDLKEKISMMKDLYIGWLLSFELVLFCDGFISMRLRDRHGARLGLGAPPFPGTLPPFYWFTQQLDHFQPTDLRTWQQRYQVVKDYYVEGGPVFIHIEGETEASPWTMVSGAWIDYAKRYNALIFQLEHRYYGQSEPTSDLSVENLKYLSSEQALADLAYFIVAMNAQHKLPANTKWIALGGSYPGNLAAWIRLKYPHLIHASVSSSSPVLAKLDFPEYMDVVKAALGTHSSQCVGAVEAAYKHMNTLLTYPSGRNLIAKEFRLCDPIDVNNVNDVTNLYEVLSVHIAGAVQGNDAPYLNIYTLCNIMVNETLGNPLSRYSKYIDIYLRSSMCLEYKYDNSIKGVKNITWQAHKWDQQRQWAYQTCTEFGYYQSSERKHALFGDRLPVDFFIQQCSDIFGKEFTKEMLTRAVDRTNTMYGGLDLKATRVVYVHGSIDPWHALGITTTRIPDSPAIFINGTSHCANMYPPADSDLPALKAAREEISALIGKWLQEP